MGGMEPRRRKETLIALLAVGVVLALVAVLLFALGVLGGDEERKATPKPTPTTTSSAKPKPKKPINARFPAALVVKIDSVREARPYTGIGRANAMYVEPIEGGYSRMLAVYWGKRPPVVGPVRSARETDIQLLQQFRKPVLAYSGAASQIKGALRRSSLVLASTNSGAFYRGRGQIPHNMFVNARQLPKTKPVASPMPFGKAPRGGRKEGRYRVAYRSATYDFVWRGGAKKWLISMDGSPLTATDSGRLAAQTVVVQRVKTYRGRVATDPAGNPSPVVRTVGKGKVTVLRDGKAYGGTWSRSNPAKSTVYRTSSGKPLPLARGKVWVLLVPA